MQITRLVTFLLVCFSYAKSLSDSRDIIEGIIDIRKHSIIIFTQTEIEKSVIQNIGKVEVQIDGTFIQPCERKTIVMGGNRSEIINRNQYNRAILYISTLSNDFIEAPVENYDMNKVLKKAFNLGVKYIPEECKTLDTLKSYFWPEDNDNVWEQIFDVIKVLLDPVDRHAIYQYIKVDLGFLKTYIDDLNRKVENNQSNIMDAYEFIARKLGKDEDFFKSMKSNTSDDDTLHLYILPLYSNIITLKMYFYALGARNPKMFYLDEHTFHVARAAWDTIYDNNVGAMIYICTLNAIVTDKMYETVYAGGLYNVMMNAYSHLALHGLDMFAIWRQIYYKTINQTCSDLCNSDRFIAISYSNFYGRATPDLLQQAIHIKKSSLSAHYVENENKAAELNSIVFNITNGTVCGLKLQFSSNLNTIIGTFDTASQENMQILDVSNDQKIMELTVYEDKNIRCLEFTVLGKNITKILFGNNCNNNSACFNLEGHYINSLYLANDYPETGEYFDNIAVSFLPYPVKVF